MCNGNCAECSEKSDCERCGTDECRGKQQPYAAFREGTTSTWKLRPIKEKYMQIGRPCQTNQIGGCKCHPILRCVFNFSGVTPEEMERYGAEILAEEGLRNWKQQSRGGKNIPLFLKLLLIPVPLILVLGPIALAAWFWNTAGFRDDALASRMTIFTIIWLLPAGCIPELFFLGIDMLIRTLHGDRCPFSNPTNYIDQTRIVIEP